MKIESSGDRGPQHGKRARPNRLITERSHYLLQHATNPVDWFPWGEEAFLKAKNEDKPVFLSIGYSTCHWCHVMERETFEDEEAARLMNETFISVKVDREERPDIDHIYMTVCQMMTGGGGWPLSMIMTWEKNPFFAATYIPRESRSGRIGMIDLCRRVQEIWLARRQDVFKSADEIALALRQLPDATHGEAPGTDVLDAAYRQMVQRYDARRGGFSEAPKFPSPHNLYFLLRYWQRTRSPDALRMVEKTLDEMRMGGIYDHVGFGFHRYSTDEKWLVPHFEKMLYDQAMLAIAYIEAYQATGKEEYASTAREIFTYVMRDMTSPEGAFYSAEDADSEGEEGKFYVWTLDELVNVLGEPDGHFAAGVFNVNAAGNFAEEATGKPSGTNVLHLARPVEEMAGDLGLSEQDLRDRVEELRSKLFQWRETRVRPHRDDKILTDWNGLMIAALARGAQVLEYDEYAAASKKAADFILESLRTPDGGLLHRFREGQAGITACADDYAFFIWGLLELYEATFDCRYLEASLELNHDFLKYFWDHDSGGFHFTASHAEQLPARKKELYDGAVPSANSVAALNLLRISRITGNHDLEETAEALATAFAGTIRQFPSAYTQMLTALEFALATSYEVVIAGNPGAEDVKDLLRALRRPFLPNKVVILRPTGVADPEITKFAKYSESHTALDGKATAYVCRNFNCSLPTTDPHRMLEVLGVKNP